MTQKQKEAQVRQWYADGRIRELGNYCYAVPSEAFVMGITSRIVDKVMRKITKERKGGEHEH